MTLQPDELRAVALSAQVAAVATLASAAPGVALGWILSRWRFRGRMLVETVIMLPLVLPPVVVGYGLLVLLGRRGPIGRVLEDWLGAQIAFTWWGAAIAAGVVGFPLLVRSCRLGFDAVDPRLEGMARTLGAGRVRTWLRVTLPLAWPALVAGLTLAFARAWGEFGATIMIAGNIEGRTRTVPLAIYSAMQTPGQMAQVWRLAALSVIVALAAMLLSEWLARRAGRTGASQERPLP
ncbi:MAG: molybdate ABC transporter permease subunit [Phycisphaerales bacterium JB039]